MGSTGTAVKDKFSARRHHLNFITRCYTYFGPLLFYGCMIASKTFWIFEAGKYLPNIALEELALELLEAN